MCGRSDALAVLTNVLDTHPEAVAAHGLSRFIGGDGEPIAPGELEMWGRCRAGIKGRRIAEWPLHEPTKFAVLAHANCIGAAGQVLIRRSALDAVGSFDALAPACEDWDMWLRLSRCGDIAFVDRVVLNYRSRGGSTLSAERFARGRDYVRRKLLSCPDLAAEQVRIVRAATSLYNLRACSGRLRAAKRSFAQGHLREAGKLLRQVVAGCLMSLRGGLVA